MAEAIVGDWLADYAAIEPAEIKSFAAQHEHNHDVSSALYSILNEKAKYPDLLLSVCNQLCSFYRSTEEQLKRFVLQFVPIFSYIYLNSVAQGDKSFQSIETLLLFIYNAEVCNEEGQPKKVSHRMPILAQPSVYHEEKTLQAIDLRRWEQNSNKEISWGPHTPIDTINAKNRLPVLTCLLFVYNQQLSLIQKPALYHLCKMTSQIANQGFTKYGHTHRASYGSDPGVLKPLPRIPLSEKFLLELLHATYFAMFNEFASAAIQAVDDVHSRACFEIFPDVVLVTNAIRNSLYANPSGQPSDGPMGISVALTPASHTVTVSKSMITNASFRTKKLPDDIPIVPKEDPSQLQSINEETEGDIPKAAVKPKEAKLHMPFAAGFKKLKDKDKEKEKEKSTNKNANAEVVKRTKDKTLSKNVSSSDMIDSEKNSPQTLMKRKSSNLDIAGPPTNEFGSLVANGNGGGGGNGVNNSDSGLTIGSDRGSMDVGESFDSGNDLVSNNTLRSSNDMKNHGSIQVSQV